MSNSNRRLYLDSNVLDQDFLDACQDNLENKLELVVEIETGLSAPNDFIRVSDRPKYIGSTFYDNRLVFPLVQRTIGEWLSPDLQFSAQKLELNNADGEYDEFLPGGVNYSGFIGKSVEIKLGLRDVLSTYTTIFKGFITDVGGFARTVRSIVITARDDFEKLNVKFPTAILESTNFPDIGTSSAGKVLPVIYGDWTTAGNPVSNNAVVPAYVVNEQDPDVNGDTSNTNPVELYISINENRSFDTSNVWLKRGDNRHLIDSADINSVIQNRTFKIDQDTGNTLIENDDGSTKNYLFESGDEFVVTVEGKDIGVGYQDNIVEIARDILLSFTSITAGEFDTAVWDSYRDKVGSPNNISTIKARVWVQDPQDTMQYALSLLEQVRLEAFIDRNLLLTIRSLHFDEFESSPDFRVRNYDVVEGSLQPQLDIKNNFNRGQAVYNFHPDINENSERSFIYKNDDAINQVGRAISNEVTFPNLYEVADVENQLVEILRIASSGFEHVVCDLTWRALLLDIGDFVKLDVKIGSTVFEEVPCLIRDIGYDPEGLKIPVRLWSFQLIPFTGYAGVPNSVGGSTAIIDKEPGA